MWFRFGGGYTFIWNVNRGIEFVHENLENMYPKVKQSREVKRNPGWSRKNYELSVHYFTLSLLNGEMEGRYEQINEKREIDK